MKRLHILHIEDDAADAELIGLALQAAHLDCDIRVVKSRKECVQALEEGTFDLVLSDSHGHDFTASDLLPLVRGYLPAVPFIHVSGSFLDKDPEKLEAQGATGCVLKDDLGTLAGLVQDVARGIPD